MTPARAAAAALDELAALDAGTLVATGAYTVIVAVVAADVIAARRGGRRAADRAQLRVAATLAAGAVAAGVAYGAAIIAAYRQLVTFAPWHEWMQVRPVVAFAAAFIAVDAATWVHHRVSHRTRWGWVCHRPHHTGDTYDATLALRQSWIPLPSLLVMPAAAITGAPVSVFVAAVAAVGLYSAATHSSAPWRLPRWCSTVLVTPDTHRRHHSDGSQNLGAVLTIWDRLAGTHEPGHDPSAPIGVNDGRSLQGALLGARHTPRTGAPPSQSFSGRGAAGRR